jgi:hypothetical protein
MSIDTGQSLIYAQNFPVPNVDQPSQQFRDNFGVIKTAIENLHVAKSNALSIANLATSLNSAGEVIINISYKNNGLVLPIGAPTGNAVAGMIRFNAGTTILEFNDNGTSGGWRKVISEDANNNVSFVNATVSSSLILNYNPTSGTQATNKTYVDGLIASSGSNSNAAYSFLQTQINSNSALLLQEITNRQNGDLALGLRIGNAEVRISNLEANGVTFNQSLTDLGTDLTNEINARQSADQSLTTYATGLETRIGVLESNSVSFQLKLDQEATYRIANDALLRNEINAVSSATSLNANAIAQEITNRQNAITTVNQSISNVYVAIADEAQARQDGDGNLQTQIDALVVAVGSTVYYTAIEPSTGGAKDGDLWIDNANSIANTGNDYLRVFDNATSTWVDVTLTTPGDTTLANTNVIIDANSYGETYGIKFQKLPNTVGAGDGGFLMLDQNNFNYAYITNTAIANAIANSIIANGVANTNSHYEYSALRIGTTNDQPNGVNDDSMALEPAAHLWLNPGFSGVDAGRVPNITGAKVFIGNATNHPIVFSRDTGDIKTIGSINADGDVSGLSDESVKENVDLIEDALAKVKQLQGVTFNRNDMAGYPRKMGLIAQHVEQVAPEAITENEQGKKLVAYGVLVGLLVEAIKELSAEVDELKDKLK